jgi:ribosome maturation factor RimP
MQASNENTSKTVIDLDRIRAVVQPVLSTHGVSLVDVEWFTEQGAWTLRLTIERESAVAAGDVGGGVTLEDCAEVSRDVSSVLDVQDDIIAHKYSLEVSSPGLDRKLRTATDFQRFVGKTARVKLSKPAPDGQRLLRGPLAEAPEGMVAVIVDGKRIEAPYADVAEARLVFELAPQPKKGTRQNKGQRGKPKAGSR